MTWDIHPTTLRFADADRCRTVALAKQGCAKSPNVEAFEGRNFSEGNSVANNALGSPILSLQVLCCYFLEIGALCCITLSWNSLCRTGWLQIYRGPLASAYRVLGLEVSITMACMITVKFSKCCRCLLLPTHL